MDDFDKLIAELMATDQEFKEYWIASRPEHEAWVKSRRAQERKWEQRIGGHVHKPIKIKMCLTYGKKARKQTHIVVKTVKKY